MAEAAPAAPLAGPGGAGGAGYRPHLAQRVKAVLPDVLVVYPDAHVEVVRHGLRLLPSKPPVPRTLVGGFRVVEGGAAHRIGSRRQG